MPNILVIEDNTQMRSALTRMLQTSGHRVTLQKPFSLSELNAAIAAALQDSDQKWA